MISLRLISALATLMLVVPGCSGPAREWSPEQATLLSMSKHEWNAEIYLKDGPDGTWRNVTRNILEDGNFRSLTIWIEDITLGEVRRHDYCVSSPRPHSVFSM